MHKNAMNHLADFYTSIPAFSNFREMTDGAHYRSAPPDWVVIITDIEGSTDAIERGAYREVNLIGVASIVVLLQSLKCDFPFVFGGDGATILVPPEQCKAALKTLQTLATHARQAFNLHLRIGYIEVGHLVKQDAVLEVARFRLRGGCCIALFRGGAISLAERLIKENPEYQLASSNEVVDQGLLEGLSCRWNNIPARSGEVLSLLVVPRPISNSGRLEAILMQIDDVFLGQLEQGNPVNVELSGYKTAFQCIRQERRFYSSWFCKGFIKRIIKILLAVALFRWGLSRFFPTIRHYLSAIKAHSDFRKLDDVLRLTLDCTLKQGIEIEELLKRSAERGEIFYGIHRANFSQMTCFVEGLDDSEHIHFIDGGNGGYAMAAKQLKEMIKASKASEPSAE